MVYSSMPSMAEILSEPRPAQLMTQRLSKVSPPAVTVQEWFVYLTVAVTVLCVVVPCVIYYLRTPPGIDHK